MECAEAAASAEKTTDAAADDAVEKNPTDPDPALEKTTDAAGDTKTKGASFEKKKTREKKDKKGTAKNTKAPFKPPRPAEVLGKAPADDAADEAGTVGAEAGEVGAEAGEDAGDEAGEGDCGVDPVASQTSKSGGKRQEDGRHRPTDPCLRRRAVPVVQGELIFL